MVLGMNNFSLILGAESQSGAGGQELRLAGWQAPIPGSSLSSFPYNNTCSYSPRRFLSHTLISCFPLKFKGCEGVGGQAGWRGGH